jgi:hypothetical protein
MHTERDIAKETVTCIVLPPNISFTWTQVTQLNVASSVDSKYKDTIPCHGYTGCPKSPDAVLRGYISGTPGTTEMAWFPKDASHPLVFSGILKMSNILFFFLSYLRKQKFFRPIFFCFCVCFAIFFEPANKRRQWKTCQWIDSFPLSLTRERGEREQDHFHYL